VVSIYSNRTEGAWIHVSNVTVVNQRDWPALVSIAGTFDDVAHLVVDRVVFQAVIVKDTLSPVQMYGIALFGHFQFVPGAPGLQITKNLITWTCGTQACIPVTAMSLFLSAELTCAQDDRTKTVISDNGFTGINIYDYRAVHVEGTTIGCGFEMSTNAFADEGSSDQLAAIAAASPPPRNLVKLEVSLGNMSDVVHVKNYYDMEAWCRVLPNPTAGLNASIYVLIGSRFRTVNITGNNVLTASAAAVQDVNVSRPKLSDTGIMVTAAGGSVDIVSFVFSNNYVSSTTGIVGANIPPPALGLLASRVNVTFSSNQVTRSCVGIGLFDVVFNMPSLDMIGNAIETHCNCNAVLPFALPDTWPFQNRDVHGSPTTLKWTAGIYYGQRQSVSPEPVLRYYPTQVVMTGNSIVLTCDSATDKTPPGAIGGIVLYPLDKTYYTLIQLDRNTFRATSGVAGCGLPRAVVAIGLANAVGVRYDSYELIESISIKANNISFLDVANTTSVESDLTGVAMLPMTVDTSLINASYNVFDISRERTKETNSGLDAIRGGRAFYFNISRADTVILDNNNVNIHGTGFHVGRAVHVDWMQLGNAMSMLSGGRGNFIISNSTFVVTVAIRPMGIVMDTANWMNFVVSNVAIDERIISEYYNVSKNSDLCRALDVIVNNASAVIENFRVRIGAVTCGTTQNPCPIAGISAQLATRWSGVVRGQHTNAPDYTVRYSNVSVMGLDGGPANAQVLNAALYVTLYGTLRGTFENNRVSVFALTLGIGIYINAFAVTEATIIRDNTATVSSSYGTTTQGAFLVVAGGQTLLDLRRNKISQTYRDSGPAPLLTEDDPNVALAIVGSSTTALIYAVQATYVEDNDVIIIGEKATSKGFCHGIFIGNYSGTNVMLINNRVTVQASPMADGIALSSGMVFRGNVTIAGNAVAIRPTGYIGQIAAVSTTYHRGIDVGWLLRAVFPVPPAGLTVLGWLNISRNAIQVCGTWNPSCAWSLNATRLIPGAVNAILVTQTKTTAATTTNTVALSYNTIAIRDHAGQQSWSAAVHVQGAPFTMPGTFRMEDNNIAVSAQECPALVSQTLTAQAKKAAHSVQRNNLTLLCGSLGTSALVNMSVMNFLATEVRDMSLQVTLVSDRYSGHMPSLIFYASDAATGGGVGYTTAGMSDVTVVVVGSADTFTAVRCILQYFGGVTLTRGIVSASAVPASLQRNFSVTALDYTSDTNTEEYIIGWSVVMLDTFDQSAKLMKFNSQSDIITVSDNTLVASYYDAPTNLQRMFGIAFGDSEDRTPRVAVLNNNISVTAVYDSTRAPRRSGVAFWAVSLRLSDIDVLTISGNEMTFTGAKGGAIQVKVQDCWEPSVIASNVIRARYPGDGAVTQPQLIGVSLDFNTYFLAIQHNIVTGSVLVEQLLQQDDTELEFVGFHAALTMTFDGPKYTVTNNTITLPLVGTAIGINFLSMADAPFANFEYRSNNITITGSNTIFEPSIVAPRASAQGIVFDPVVLALTFTNNVIVIETTAWIARGVAARSSSNLTLTGNTIRVRSLLGSLLPTISTSSAEVVGIAYTTLSDSASLTGNAVSAVNDDAELANRRVRAVSLCENDDCSMVSLDIRNNILTATQAGARSTFVVALCVLCDDAADGVSSFISVAASASDVIVLHDNVVLSGSVSFGETRIAAGQTAGIIITDTSLSNGTITFRPSGPGAAVTYLLQAVSTFYQGDVHSVALDLRVLNEGTTTFAILDSSFEIIGSPRLTSSLRGIDFNRSSGGITNASTAVWIYLADTAVRVSAGDGAVVSMTGITASFMIPTNPLMPAAGLLIRNVAVDVTRSASIEGKSSAIGLEFGGRGFARLLNASIAGILVTPPLTDRPMLITGVRVTVSTPGNESSTTVSAVTLVTAEHDANADAIRTLAPVEESVLRCAAPQTGGACLDVKLSGGAASTNVTFNAIDVSTTAAMAVEISALADGVSITIRDGMIVTNCSLPSNMDLSAHSVCMALYSDASHTTVANSSLSVFGDTRTVSLPLLFGWRSAVNVSHSRISVRVFGDAALLADAIPVFLATYRFETSTDSDLSAKVSLYQVVLADATDTLLPANLTLADEIPVNGDAAIAPASSAVFQCVEFRRRVLTPYVLIATQPLLTSEALPNPYALKYAMPSCAACESPLEPDLRGCLSGTHESTSSFTSSASRTPPPTRTSTRTKSHSHSRTKSHSHSRIFHSRTRTRTLTPPPTATGTATRSASPSSSVSFSRSLTPPPTQTRSITRSVSRSFGTGSVSASAPLTNTPTVTPPVTPTASRSRSLSLSVGSQSLSVHLSLTMSAQLSASESSTRTHTITPPPTRSASESASSSLSAGSQSPSLNPTSTATPNLTASEPLTDSHTITPPPTLSASHSETFSVSMGSESSTASANVTASAQLTETRGSVSLSGSVSIPVTKSSSQSGASVSASASQPLTNTLTPPPTPSTSLSVSASQLTPTHTQQLTASHSAGSATITVTDRTPTASGTINIADYAFTPSAPRSLNLRTLMYGSDPALDPLRSPLVVALHIPAGAHGWRGARGDLMRAPPGLRCTATIDSVSPTMAELADLGQWMAEKALGLRVGEHALDNLRGRIALTLYRIQTVELATTSGSGMAITVPYEPFSEANATSDTGTPDLLLDRAIEVRFAVDASCFARDRPAALPAFVNATLLAIVDVPPRVPPVLLPPSAVATSVVTSAMSGAMGSPTGATVASRSMLVASLRDCETQLGDPLPVDANPTRVWIGDADVRYHYGAAVMNAVLLLACVVLQVVVALLKMVVTRRNALAGRSALFDQLLFLLNSILGDDGANSDDDANDNRNGLQKCSASSTDAKEFAKAAMKSGSIGDAQGSQGMRAIRRHVQRKQAKARLTATFLGALRWARFPSLLVFPLMFLFQPIVQSSFVLVVYGDDTSGRVVGVALLLGTAGFVGWTCWRLRVARFPAKFVRPSRLEKRALQTEWQNILSQERGGRLSFAALRHQFILLLRSRGDWKDTSVSSESLFVRAHFLFLADYTDRCRWNILVEFGFSAALGVVGAMVEAGGCTGVDWVVLVLFTAYIAALLFLRGFESRFNFGFTLFVGAVQWLSTILAIAARYTENRGIDSAAEVLLMIAIFASSARAVHDILHTGMYIARRQGAAIFDFHRKRLQRLREANWELLLQAGGTGLPAGQSAKLIALAKQALTEAELRKMLLYEDGASWVEDTALEAAVLEQLDDAAAEPLDAVLTAPLLVVADAASVLHESTDAKSGDRQRQRQKSTAQMPTAWADLGERSAVLARGNAIIDEVELEMDIIRQQHSSHSQSIESAHTTSNQAPVTPKNASRRAVPAIHYDAAAAQQRSQARNLFVDPNSAEGREKVAKWRELIDAL
jgi:hypothetical protein